MSKGNIVYDSALSVEDNAKLNGVSVATIRRSSSEAPTIATTPGIDEESDQFTASADV